ncbi:zinc finger BED domain-containing protein 4-like [Topomyia yanbarensis]|uniref:zinc finger BED domain-containing protein 4-like n=1 Tax=Topomyia yanbarensis TaxID=2498891 RepID=UPI00273C3A87|nr:zinc finger BED domain-containing protein 4-like [Topomyia yanbarensis]
MICKEYHPLSLVEDAEFRKLVKMLCPPYTLPSRKTLTYSLMPTVYENLHATVKSNLQDAPAVSLTCDGWTSINNQGFYAITAHFFDKSNQLMSHLLECSEFNERHTGENIASWIMRVLKLFCIDSKVAAIVTDNAANMKSAASILKMNHLPCFAHTLNLLVQNAIASSIQGTVDKVKHIVQYFKKSSFALEKLHDMQGKLNENLLKLKQDVPTRWNSTYDMLDRVLRNKNSVVSTLALLNIKLALNVDDWKIIEGSVEVLKVFYEVTVEISAELNVSFSKSVVLTQIMEQRVQKFVSAENLPPEVTMLSNNLKDGLNKRFESRCKNELLSQAVILDPRFKKQGFCNENQYKSAHQSLLNQINVQQCDVQRVEDCSEEICIKEPAQSSSLWEEFDESVSKILSKESPGTTFSIELDKYMAEPILPRCNDPLIWWGERKCIYPNLYTIMQKRLCIPGTSVPCERIFSKTGQICSERRSRLTAKNISKIVFINHNL